MLTIILFYHLCFFYLYNFFYMSTLILIIFVVSYKMLVIIGHLCLYFNLLWICTNFHMLTLTMFFYKDGRERPLFLYYVISCRWIYTHVYTYFVFIFSFIKVSIFCISFYFAYVISFIYSYSYMILHFFIIFAFVEALNLQIYPIMKLHVFIWVVVTLQLTNQYVIQGPSNM